jgi:hypothetical protein
LPLRSGHGSITEAWSDRGLTVSVGRKAVARVFRIPDRGGRPLWACVNLGASCACDLLNQGEAVLMARRIAVLLAAGSPARREAA